MFCQLEIYSVLPARDLARARRFCQEVLGMEPAEERDDSASSTVSD